MTGSRGLCSDSMPKRPSGPSPGSKPFGGYRMAERAVNLLFTAGRWLMEYGILDTAAEPPKKWKDELRTEWTDKYDVQVRGQEDQERHTEAELGRLLTHMHQADPRLRLVLEFFAEARLGQGARTMRTDVVLDRDAGSLGYGRIKGPGRGRKKGVVIDLTADQRAFLDGVLREGYLRELEQAYQSRQIPDYPLLPQGRLVNGVVRVHEGPPRVRARGPQAVRDRSLKPLTRDALLKMFHELERLAGVDSKRGRGWYGVRRVSTDLAEHVESDNRVFNAITGHASDAMRREYQNRRDPTVLKKTTEARVELRALARQAGEAAATAAGEASPPTPPPTPTPESLGKVENEAPAELGDSAGVADESWRAGDRTRTGDVQLGKLAFYH